MIKEYEVPTISMIPDDTVDFQKRYYHGVYILLQCNKQDVVDTNQDQIEMEANTQEYYMEYATLGSEIQCHQGIVFEDRDRGVNDEKALLDTKRWDVYAIERE